MMEAQDSLGLIAELALVIVGFSGIVAVLGQRAAGSWTASDIGRMGVMLITAFRVLFAALLPFVFLHFQLTAEQVWMWSSGIVAAAGIWILFYLLRIAPQVAADQYHSPTFQYFALLLSIISIMINVLNSAGVVFDQTYGPYLLSLMIGFGISCMYFIRLIYTAMRKIVINFDGGG